jgi:hypothetical protein
LTNDSGASPVPEAVAVDEFLMGPCWLTIPTGGTLKFPVSANGHSLMRRTGGMAIALHGSPGFSHAWVVPDVAVEDYALSASLTVTSPQDSTHPVPWSGTIVFPPVKIPRKATP